MKKHSVILLSLPVLIISCGTIPDDQFVAECKRTTPAASSARWQCLKTASAKSEELKKQEYFNSLAQRCESFGMQRGTPTFNQCIYQQNQIETQNKLAIESLRIQQEQLGLQQINQGLQLLNTPRQVNPTITCTKHPGSYTTVCQ